MGRFINPFTDWGFKQIFGQEANKDILLFFLNNLLVGERHLTDLTFLDKEQLGSTQNDRSLIYDIYCTTDTGDHIIVEMQNKEQSFFIDRSLYYLSKAIINQGERGGNWNYKIDAVYGIFFMNFTMKEFGHERFRIDATIKDRETNDVVSDKLRMVFLQLPCFTKGENECTNDFERMIYVLKKMEVLNRMPFEKKSFIFEKLAEIAEVRKLTKQEQLQYDRSLKAYRDTINVFEFAVEKGLAKGREQGFEQGRAEGRAEGRADALLATANQMKKMGMADDVIAKATGLSSDEIDRL